jgi:glycerol kinase
MVETTALGAAYAAGLAVGFWDSPDEVRALAHGERSWHPSTSDEQRARGYAAWNAAVERSLGWV